MDSYKHIKTKEHYYSLLNSGMFWEFHPELTGEWKKDKHTISLTVEVEEFQCTCGNIGRNNFDYAFTMADGEVWKCTQCEEDIVVEFEAEEDDL